jgi:hypothetical protein
MTLRLYVWEGVLTDYTSGLVCVLAENEKQAWALLKKEDHTAWWVLLGEPDDRETKEIPPSAIRPKEVTRPKCFLVWGGA